MKTYIRSAIYAIIMIVMTSAATIVTIINWGLFPNWVNYLVVLALGFLMVRTYLRTRVSIREYRAQR